MQQKKLSTKVSKWDAGIKVWMCVKTSKWHWVQTQQKCGSEAVEIVIAKLKAKDRPDLVIVMNQLCFLTTNISLYMTKASFLRKYFVELVAQPLFAALVIPGKRCHYD